MNWLKKFVKEIKRVRWPSFNKSSRTFLVVLLFIFVSSLVLFGISFGFTELWDKLK